MTDDQASEALRWIAGILRHVGAKYQVVGGLAVRAYGGTRELVDLDLYVESARYTEVIDRVGDACVWGPEEYQDAMWDLRFAKIDWGGVRIEVAEADGARYFDRLRGVWTDQEVDFARSEERKVLGVTLPVMPREQLVSYKRGLDREVDRLDVQELEEEPKS